MTLGQVGLVLDVIGFLIIYFTGGFTFGISVYIKEEASKINLAFRIVGLLLTLVGFYFQFKASGSHA